jgi:septum site-determining protein MinC
MANLLVMRLSSDDATQIASHLQQKVDQAPGLLTASPLVLDLQTFSGNGELLATVISDILQRGIMLVAISGGNPEQAAAAAELGLGQFSLGPVRQEPAAAEAAPAAPAPVAQGRTPTKVITQPVRSGQQIYAEGGDLLVMGMVSAGAEIIADGHIHVYGALRGRAYAGAQGDESARIFCRSLDAELVAIAGVYTVNEELDSKLMRQPVQIQLAHDSLKIEKLD